QEWCGITDRAVYVALGRKIDNCVITAISYQFQNSCAVGNVAVIEVIPRITGKVREVVGIAGVRQAIEIGNRDVRIDLQLETNEVGTNEPAAPCHQYAFDRQPHAHPSCRLQSYPIPRDSLR